MARRTPRPEANYGYGTRIDGYHFIKRACPICHQPVRAGREYEHSDCQKEIDRRADAAIPNPRRNAR